MLVSSGTVPGLCLRCHPTRLDSTSVAYVEVARVRLTLLKVILAHLRTTITTTRQTNAISPAHPIPARPDLIQRFPVRAATVIQDFRLWMHTE